MRKILPLLVALGWALPAASQVQVQIQIPLPPAPRLVIVAPDIEVVEGFDDEVFFHRGWFWTRRGPVWYRARGPDAAFLQVAPGYVPAPLVRLPPGHYRHFRAEERAARRDWRAEERFQRHEEKDRRKAERRQHKDQEKAERRERKEHEKAERREQEHDRGEGHRGHDRD